MAAASRAGCARREEPDGDDEISNVCTDQADRDDPGFVWSNTRRHC